ncbi:MAG: sigma 54-interacting transcriptional regulator [Candidatus Sulfotelmatobacter sp.]
MGPRLEAIAGPLEGATFALSAELFIGRDPCNSISIPDASLAARHCSVRKRGEQFHLQVLVSSTVLANGLPVADRVLQDGDEIKIGNSVFLVLLSDMASDVPLSTSEFESPVGSTQVLKREAILAVKQSEALETFSSPTTLAHGWNNLLRVCHTVSSIQDWEELEQRLLALIAEVVPAERGAILSVGDNGGFTAVTGWDSRKEAERNVEISREVIDRVIRERVAVLTNGLGSTRGASGGTDVHQVQALLAVPLEVFNQVRGVIYVDTCDPEITFNSAQLRLVAAVGTIAALALENARRLQTLRAENRRLKAEINVQHDMVGDSPRMRQIYQMIAKIGPMDSTTLICGESGTGKELVARAIHRNSPRANNPFIAINCAAMPETLMESELFGYEKGAFTGAAVQKKGKLELANGGTVFLDEIGELAPALQAKLLRVLQERVLDRLGGTHSIPVNIRVLTATNRDLVKEVRKGSFRQDLYYRLNVVSVTMPALRERREDIGMLAEHFLAKHGAKAPRRVEGISREAQSYLVGYHWPGNVRELENTIERAIVLGNGEMIVSEDLPETLLERAEPGASPVGRFHEVVAATKRELINKALQQNHGNYTHAAKSLGLHPNYLHRLMHNLNMKGENAAD